MVDATSSFVRIYEQNSSKQRNSQQVKIERYALPGTMEDFWTGAVEVEPNLKDYFVFEK